MSKLYRSIESGEFVEISGWSKIEIAVSMKGDATIYEQTYRERVNKLWPDIKLLPAQEKILDEMSEQPTFEIRGVPLPVQPTDFYFDLKKVATQITNTWDTLESEADEPIIAYGIERR